MPKEFKPIFDLSNLERDLIHNRVTELSGVYRMREVWVCGGEHGIQHREIQQTPAGIDDINQTLQSASFQQNTSLISLDLSHQIANGYAHITDAFDIFIPLIPLIVALISRKRILSRLDLSFNTLCCPHFARSRPVIYQLRLQALLKILPVKEICLSHCRLYDDILMDTILNGLSKNPYLKKLDLSNNRLKNPGLIKVAEKFIINKKMADDPSPQFGLESLVLSYNMHGNEAAVAIEKALSSNKSLHELQLRRWTTNPFKRNSLDKQIAEHIRRNKYLNKEAWYLVEYSQHLLPLYITGLPTVIIMHIIDYYSNLEFLIFSFKQREALLNYSFAHYSNKPIDKSYAKDISEILFKNAPFQQNDNKQFLPIAPLLNEENQGALVEKNLCLLENQELLEIKKIGQKFNRLPDFLAMIETEIARRRSLEMKLSLVKRPLPHHESSLIPLPRVVCSQALTQPHSAPLPPSSTSTILLALPYSPPTQLRKKIITKLWPDYLSENAGHLIKWHTVTVDGCEKYFLEYKVTADGNCGFTALGVDRKEAVSLLKQTSAGSMEKRAVLINELLRGIENYQAAPSEEIDPTMHMQPAELGKKVKGLFSELEIRRRHCFSQCEQVRKRLNEEKAILPGGNTDEAIFTAIVSNTLPILLEEAVQNAFLHAYKSRDDKLNEAREDKEIFNAYINSYDRGNNQGLWLGEESMRCIAEAKGRGLTLWGINNETGQLQIKPPVVPAKSRGTSVHVLLKPGHYNFLVEGLIEEKDTLKRGPSTTRRVRIARHPRTQADKHNSPTTGKFSQKRATAKTHLMYSSAENRQHTTPSVKEVHTIFTPL